MGAAASRLASSASVRRLASSPSAPARRVAWSAPAWRLGPPLGVLVAFDPVGAAPRLRLALIRAAPHAPAAR